jgi:hypothetical protein
MNPATPSPITKAIPAYAGQIPQQDDAADERAYWRGLEQPAPPGAEPEAAARGMRFACGSLAGEYARQFCRARRATAGALAAGAGDGITRGGSAAPRPRRSDPL